MFETKNYAMRICDATIKKNLQVVDYPQQHVFVVLVRVQKMYWYFN